MDDYRQILDYKIIRETIQTPIKTIQKHTEYEIDGISYKIDYKFPYSKYRLKLLKLFSELECSHDDHFYERYHPILKLKLSIRGNKSTKVDEFRITALKDDYFIYSYSNSFNLFVYLVDGFDNLKFLISKGISFSKLTFDNHLKL